MDDPKQAQGPMGRISESNSNHPSNPARRHLLQGVAAAGVGAADWFEKVRGGCGTAVTLCRYSNYCEGLDQKHKQVNCELWDRTALDEPGIVRE